MPQPIGEVRLKAVQLRKEDPSMTLEAIGKECGVTKQRIYKIFQDEGIPRRPKRRQPFKFCRVCNILIQNKIFCSNECRDEALYTELPCNACGRLVKYRKYIVKYRLKQGQYNFFCSRRCFHIKQQKKE